MFCRKTDFECAVAEFWCRWGPVDFDHSTPKIVADAPQVKRGREEPLLLHIASVSIGALKQKEDEENDAAGYSSPFS